MTTLEASLEKEAEIPRIKYGKKQTVDTLINEALLLAKFLRNEIKTWKPRLLCILSSTTPSKQKN
jgi:hypothetical protein